MNNQELTYAITVHLINGQKLVSSQRVTPTELMTVYQMLGAKESRMMIPTASDTMQYLPTSSVLRIEARGNFD